MVNRQKIQHQTQLHTSRAITEVRQVVESLNQQIHALPTELANLNPITQSLEHLEHKIQKLTQQFDTRLEPQEIAQIKNQLNALALQLNNLQDTIEPADLSGMEADIANLQAHLQAIDSSSGSRIDYLQNQIKQIGQQIQDLPPPFDPNTLKQQVANLQQHLEQLPSPPKPFDSTALKLRMEEISLSIAHLQKSVAADIVSVRQELLGEIEAQHTSVLSRLEPLEAIDSSLLDSAITQLQTDLPALEHNTQEAIVQLTNQLGSLALRLDNLPTPPKPVDLSGIEGAIANLNCQLSSLTLQFDTRSEATKVQRLGEMIALAIQRLDELEQQQQNLGEISEIQQQLKDLDASTANLHNYAQQLKHDLEGRINQLHLATSALDERSQMLIEIPKRLEEIKKLNAGQDERTTTLDERIKTLAQMEQHVKTVQQSTAVLHEKVEHLLNRALNQDDIQQQLASLWQLASESTKKLESELARLSKASATQQDLDILTQLFVQEIEEAIAALPPSLPPFDPSSLSAQIENLTERVDNLPLAIIQQQLEEIHETVEGLDASTEALHDRTRNLNRIEQRVENLQHLNINLNEKVEQLHNRIPNLGGIQQNLTNLQQSLTEYVKIEGLDNLLNKLRKELLDQADVTVEKQVAQLNQLLKEIRPNYQYELVFERCGSRKVLLEALQQAKHRLILVCPWLTSYGVDYQVIQNLEVLLQRNVYIDIGWGNQKDIDKLGVCSSSIRQRLKSSSDYYNALSKLEALEHKYSTRFKLKLLGTHEKFIVCDNRFAMLGSHNFLTSDDRKSERELGLKTNDPYIISDLIKRFDDAKNLEPINSTVKLSSALNELDEVDIYF